MPEPLIVIENLLKTVDQNPVVAIEKLEVSAGEIVALVGPVGSGKEPLLELLIGRSRPSAGSLRLAGADPLAQRDLFSQRVGVLFAGDSLYARRSARANLGFHCQLRGLPKSRADEVLAQVGLADQARRNAGKLTSGLARRLAFGCSILHAPQVLLLMDPFARCDEASLTVLGRLMRQLAEDGAALLIMADDKANLELLCDTIHVLNQGRIVDTLRPAEEQESRLPFKIPVRLEGRVALVNPADILYADTEAGRAYLQTIRERLPTQYTLTELEERLARSGFFRAHRGYLVNLQHVREVIPYTRNSYSLILDDAPSTEIPLSKAAAAELRDLLGY